LHFAGSDLLIHARTVLLGGLRGFHWSANGDGLLCCYDEPATAGEARIVTNCG
jgi:hypothetical protein